MAPTNPERDTGRTSAGGPLTELVDDKLNRPLLDQIEEALEKKDDEPPSGGARDYARGTAEHADDSET
jgi:hypothetical protein